MARANTTGAARGTLGAPAAERPANEAYRRPAGAGEAEEEAGGSSTYLVPGLERGLRILSEFSAREPVLGAPELSKRIGIPRTTTFRLLQTLEALGFLERVNGDRV